MQTADTTCFHCGEPLPAARTPLFAQAEGAAVSVCCPGCCAAVELVQSLGLQDFYCYRASPSPQPEAESTPWRMFDEPALLETFTRPVSGGREALLQIDGMTCAACSWLISRSLGKLAGVLAVSVNTATGRAQVRFNDVELKLSQILGLLSGLGYRPQFVSADKVDMQAADERRGLLKRLAVSGCGMMQVMMFAVALYVGPAQGMDGEVRTFLRLVSLLVSTPVLLYAGWPYFRGAVQALSVRAVTMDVPVSIGLLLAYGASLVNIARNAGDVYFDSVTMFLFFLTTARYVEMVARHQSTRLSDSIGRLLPATAHRQPHAKDPTLFEEVPVAALATGDLLQVRPGEVVPADGILIEGIAQFDESMLTGESVAIEHPVGEALIGGTINNGGPVIVRVTATGRHTILSHIVAVLTRAQTERPRITRAADDFAGRFLLRVLIGAAGVCLAWCCIDPSRAFEATLAVLVVACPCAFSLATLVAVASAHAALARQGVLVANPDAIERLAKVTRVIFDKTGTLTRGAVTLAQCSPRGALSQEHCLAIAAALQLGSEHPIARAFKDVPTGGRIASGVCVVPGAGVSGEIDGTAYRIGTRAFALTEGTMGSSVEPVDAALVLASDRGVLATFELADELRPEAPETLGELRDMGLTLSMLSGDAASAVTRIARRCGLTEALARQSPTDKLERVRDLTARGEVVAMVGDGINDAPVFAGAGVSIAMSRGSPLTLASADLILIGDSLKALPATFRIARKASRVMRQNLAWAAAYNLTAMPLAALGWVPPWAAAIGMSASSIFVVLNALRLVSAPTQGPMRSTGAALELEPRAS